MNRFFLPAGELSGGRIEITGQNLKHMRLSLRLKPGDEFIVCDGEGTDYCCRLESVTERLAQALIISKLSNGAEPLLRASLFFGLPKGDKADMIIEKSVELGVYELCPFISSRCVSRPDGGSLARKRERWQAIAEAAAKQAGRGIIPQVRLPISYAEALNVAAVMEKRLFFYEKSKERVIRKEDTRALTAAVITGPEGGFSDEEASAAAEAGFEMLSLGDRILRCETAPLAALSVLMNFDAQNKYDRE